MLNRLGINEKYQVDNSLCVCKHGVSHWLRSLAKMIRHEVCEILAWCTSRFQMISKYKNIVIPLDIPSYIFYKILEMQYKQLAAITLALAAHAIPTSPETHDVQLVRRNGVHSAFYYPKPITKSFPVSHVAARDISNEDITKIATDALVKEFKISPSELAVSQSHTDEAGVTHIYFIRNIDGVPVDNNNSAVHIKNGKVIQLSSSFSGGLQKRSDLVNAPTVIVSLDEAVKKATQELGAPRDSIPAKFVYVQLASGKFVYAHQFQLQNEDSTKFYQVTVAADNGQLIQVVDFVNKASYKVLALPNNDPRDGFTTVTDPADATASPNGWHKDTKSYKDTQGNNAISAVSGTTATGGSALNFNTAFDASSAPTTTANKRAATVNSFYCKSLSF
ncbi:hypothetical protein BC833DRAFT_357894 [Globomyces pollinis-pini]|nr:hypothetical protein BC833DRAFT_357894 [Globomyces pollinis-pini]